MRTSASGDGAEGISWIEQGLIDLQATGAVLALPRYLALKAEALQLADRTSEALESINEAEALAQRFENRYWSAELHRLRGVLLAAMAADETQIKDSFCAAFNTAKEQKSISLEKRAEASFAEYRSPKKRAGQEDPDSDYLFGNRAERVAFCSADKANQVQQSEPIARDCFYRSGHPLTQLQGG